VVLVDDDEWLLALAVSLASMVSPDSDVGAVSREVILPYDGFMSYAANSYYGREAV